MFENLAQKLGDVFRQLRSHGLLTDENMAEGMRQIRTALLEADVNYRVARDFVQAVSEKAVGQQVIKSVSPGQQVVKIVHDELVNLMGPAAPKLSMADEPPTVIMIAGLQGTGKTSTCAKLGVYFRKRGHKPLLVAADLQRPAAVEQLRLLAQQAELPLYAEDDSDPVRVAKNSLPHATRHGNDIIVLDTAGRLHVDTEMMEQVRHVAAAASPHHILLVADAMTGQDAVNSAREFDEQLELTGLVLTKLDGDARGGAALSIKSVTGKPVMFKTVSEHLDGLEEFHPDRMASRILGMGDVVGLVEKAQETMDLQQAAALQEKIRKEKLGLDDFLNQLRQLRKMGPLKGLLEKIPGLSKNLPLDEFDESELTHVEAMIFSMTPKERLDPDIIDASRRRRIALGSGADPAEVAQFLKQFRQMRKAMKHAVLGGGMGGLLQGAMFGRVPRVKMRSKRLKPRKRKRGKRR